MFILSVAIFFGRGETNEKRNVEVGVGVEWKRAVVVRRAAAAYPSTFTRERRFFPQVLGFV